MTAHLRLSASLALGLTLICAGCGDDPAGPDTGNGADATPSPTPRPISTDPPNPRETPEPTPTPGLMAPVLSNGAFTPNTVLIGGRVSLTLDYDDPDGDLAGGVLKVVYNATLQANIDDAIIDDRGFTVSAAFNLPATLEAGDYQVMVSFRDAGNLESTPVAVPLTVVDDPCFRETQREPNDQPQQAVALDLGEPFTACSEDASDEDLFLVRTAAEPAAGGYLTVSVTSQGADFGLSPTAVIMTQDQVSITEILSAGPEIELKAWAAVKAGTFYLVRVKPFDGVNDLYAPYEIEVDYHPVEDPYEPNNSRDRAAEIMAGTTVRDAYFFFAFEQSEYLPDFYKFTAAAAGEISVEIPRLPEIIAPVVKLYGPTGDMVAERTILRPGQTVTGDLKLEVMGGPGQYVIEVDVFNELVEVSGSGHEPAEQLRVPYHLRVKVDSN